MDASNVLDALPSHRTGRIIAPHTASRAHPIAVRSGDPLKVSDRCDHWRDPPEWVWTWCIGPDGRAGWVPDADIERTGERATIRRDYDATELTVQTGEEVTVEREESGWFWCVTRQGARGWIPIENVAL